MRLENLRFRYHGKIFEGQVAMPDTILEAIELLGENETYSAFIAGYTERQKRRMRFKRLKKTLKLDLAKLTPEQIQALKKLGILDQNGDYAIP